jgi:hypothetical protein
MNHDELDRELGEALDSLRDVPLPDEGRQAAQHAAFLAGAREQRRLAQAEAQTGRRRRWGFFRPAPALSRRWAMAAVAVVVVLALVASSGGVIYAADAAVPGDPLYGIDQAVESARLGLTRRPESVLNLLLALAEERLLEAEELAAQQDEGNLGAVLDTYGATVSLLAQALGTVESADQPALTALLDSAFSDHETRLTRILGPAVAADPADVGDEGEEPEEGGAEYCVGAEPQPAAQALAETYGVTYEEIMGWFCAGYGLGEIEHALQTGAVTGMTPGELLALKTELGGWGEVWQHLGLIGSADDGAEELTEEELTEEEMGYCVGVEPHPVAQRLAETYGVPYEQIMGWFCQGRYGLGEIMHALQTGDDEDGNTPEQLLHRKTELGGWGQVWQEMGLIGRPDDDDEETAKDKPAKPEKLPKVKPVKKDKPKK